jgi:hypothetical protein
LIRLPIPLAVRIVTSRGKNDRGPLDLSALMPGFKGTNMMLADLDEEEEEEVVQRGHVIQEQASLERLSISQPASQG